MQVTDCDLPSVKLSGSTAGVSEVDTTEKYGAVYEDIIRRVPDVAKARERLGWQAETDVRTGIAKTLEWAKANDWYLA